MLNLAGLVELEIRSGYVNTQSENGGTTDEFVSELSLHYASYAEDTLSINSTLIVFGEHSFSHVRLPYNNISR